MMSKTVTEPMTEYVADPSPDPDLALAERRSAVISIDAFRLRSQAGPNRDFFSSQGCGPLGQFAKGGVI
jgi:hypothetical protein